MTSPSSNSRAHTLVIGCSLAGLLPARVLGDHFEGVTLLERDPVNDFSESRRGQAQTCHLHGLLAQGFRIIKRFFPDLETTLAQGGAIVCDMGESIRWYHHDGYKIQFPSGLSGVSVSRVFLEWQIRKAVLALPNVTLRAPCEVRGLVTDSERHQILGVQVVSDVNGDQATTIVADLVVDASGRGSSVGKWLEGLGFERPPEDEIKVGVGYATRVYRRRPDDLVGAKLVMISPTPTVPPNSRPQTHRTPLLHQKNGNKKFHFKLKKSLGK